MNKLCHVTPTPGQFEGAQVSFKTVLSEQISAIIKEKTNFNINTDKLKIKISGDGPKMSQKSNFVLLSSTFLQQENEVMSAKGNHTFAVVNGSEKYETLKVSFKNVFVEINYLISKSVLIVDDQEIKLEFFLGGDYKFLLKILGLKGATSLHACLWCKVHKDKRWETDKHFNHFNTNPMARTLNEIKKYVNEGKGRVSTVV